MAASALSVVAGRPVSPCPAIQKDSGFALDTPLEGNNWSELVAVEGKGNPSMGDNSSWDRVRSNYMHVIGKRSTNTPVRGDHLRKYAVDDRSDSL